MASRKPLVLGINGPQELGAADTLTLVSPVMTGSPLVTTASVGTNTTQAASTAFVAAAVANVPVISYASFLKSFVAYPAYSHTIQDNFGLSIRGSSTVTSADITLNSAFTRADMIQGVGVLSQGSDITQINGVAGYVRVDTPTDASIGGAGGAWVGAGIFGYGRSTVDGSSVWGGSVIVTDGGSGDGTGRRVFGFEVDVNVTQANTTATGLIITGGTAIQPINPVGAIIGRLGPGGVWTDGWKVEDGASLRALTVGLSRPLNNPSVGGTTSMLVDFRTLNSSNTLSNVQLFATANTLHLTSGAGQGGASLALDTGSLRISANGTPSSFAASFQSYASDGTTLGTTNLYATGGDTLNVGGKLAAATSDGSAASAPQLLARNSNGNTGFAGVGFCSASETANPKAGIGLVRAAANGVGDMIFYVSNDSASTAKFTAAHERMRLSTAGALTVNGGAVWTANSLAFGSGITATVSGGVTTLSVAGGGGAQGPKGDTGATGPQGPSGYAAPRTVNGTADTPTTADRDAVLICTSSSAVTITVNDLGGYLSFGVVQAGAGQVTIAAGAGVTLASDKATASYATARRWAGLTVICTGTGTVAVLGNTA